MTEQERNTALSHTLVRWFSEHGKVYPWRETHDPWAILVSEIMLQQTTIPTVLKRYEAWMAQFPTPSALAQATEEEALRSWEGLGYYSRVRSLQSAAQIICSQHEGKFPRDAAQLRCLPGIGDYTVGAVLSFAFNIPAPLVDANVARVLARLDNVSIPVDTSEGRKYLNNRAEELLDRSNPRAFNSAIMELGQTYCLPNRPNCLLCPCREYCRAESPELLPLKSPRHETIRETHCDLLCVTPKGILLEKQAAGKRHRGMYRLPRRTPDETHGLPLLGKQNYSVTHYKITRFLYSSKDVNAAHPHEEWITLSDLENIPMASPDRKIIRRFLPDSQK